MFPQNLDLDRLHKVIDNPTGEFREGLTTARVVQAVGFVLSGQKLVIMTTKISTEELLRVVSLTEGYLKSSFIDYYKPRNNILALYDDYRKHLGDIIFYLEDEIDRLCHGEDVLTLELEN